MCCSGAAPALMLSCMLCSLWRVGVDLPWSMGAGFWGLPAIPSHIVYLFWPCKLKRKKKKKIGPKPMYGIAG